MSARTTSRRTTTRRSVSPRTRPRPRSRRPTASWPASTTPTPTRATPRPRRSSRRSPRRTTSCPTRSSARSTTRRARCSAAGSGCRPAPRRGRRRGRRRSTSATCSAGRASAAAGSATCSAASSAAAARRRSSRAAARRRRRGRGHAVVHRRDRRRDRPAAAVRPGPLPDLRAAAAPSRARRPGSARTAPAPAVDAATRAASRSPSRAGLPGPRPGRRRPVPDLHRHRPGDHHPDVRARIPAGVADGQRIRLKGKGEPGERGGPAGDLYVPVHVKPHEVFGRKGDNLTLTRAGHLPRGRARRDVKVPTLRGPAGHGARSRRARPTAGAAGPRQGRPAQDGTIGDLLVTVEVAVPQD